MRIVLILLLVSITLAACDDGLFIGTPPIQAAASHPATVGGTSAPQ